MAIPGYVMAFAMVGIFEYSGPFNNLLKSFFGSSIPIFNIYSYPGLVLTLSLSLYPYSYLLMRNAFQTQAKKSLEIGRSLGFSSRRSILRISLPLAKPWILGAASLTIMETIADFGTVSVFNYDTLTTVIYKSWFDLFSISTVLQVASILLVAFFIYLNVKFVALCFIIKFKIKMKINHLNPIGLSFLLFFWNYILIRFFITNFL